MRYLIKSLIRLINLDINTRDFTRKVASSKYSQRPETQLLFRFNNKYKSFCSITKYCPLQYLTLHSNCCNFARYLLKKYNGFISTLF